MGEYTWLLYTLITIGVVMGVILTACAYQILLERKVAAYVQDRIGPNRVGPFGLLQPVADGLKFLLKEDIIPSHVDRVFYLLAPAVAVSTALLAFAVVPFGPTTVSPPPPPAGASIEQQQEYQQALAAYKESYQFVIAPRVNIGFLFAFAVSSLAVYGIILGGWSANNKYSMLGALRSSAQIISYEIPLGMSILGVLLFTGSLNLEQVIEEQVNHGWNFLYQPVAFLIFLAAVFAECNRLPFDLPEAEQELVGGYHTEYSALKFALFFLGEYAHMITTSYLLAIFFFGGWHFPWITQSGLNQPILKVLILGLKGAFFILVYMMVRWTLPRFRFDQLMGLAWKTLIPVALVNLVCVMIVLELGWSRWWLLPISIGLLLGAGFLTLRQPASARSPRAQSVGGPDRLQAPVAG